MTPTKQTRTQFSAGAALIVALIGLFVWPQPGEATVLLDMSIEDLTRHADCVVIVDIERQWVEHDEEVSQTHTYTAFRVVEVLHVGTEMGAVPQEGTIEQEGGFLGDHGVYVAGNASLQPGERALLFLTYGDFFYVLGMEQGKYTIDAGDDAVERVYRASTVPVMTQRISGTSYHVEHVVAPMSGATLDELVRRIGEAGGGR